MRRIHLLSALVCACLMAQDTGFVAGSKAPKETNEALRSRVTGFYQAFVDGKFRKADEFVAEDTKDAFYASEKQPLKGFEIIDIFYTPDFEKAKVVTKISAEAGGVQYGRFTVQPVVQSLWKFEDGKWWFYTPPVRVVDSPFGKMVMTPEKPGQPVAPATSILGAKRMTPEEVFKQIGIDRDTVTFSSKQASTETVNLTNGMPGPITLMLESYQNTPGLTVELTKSHLNAGEKAPVLRLAFKPAGIKPPPFAITIRVDQTGQRFPVLVKFTDDGPQKPSTK